MKFKLIILFFVYGIRDYSYAEVVCKNKFKLLDNFVQDRREEFPQETIRPKIQHARHKRSLEHTLEKNGLHADQLILTYRYNNKDVTIDLHLNDHLIPVGHFISYKTKNEGKIVKTLNKTEIDLCHYHGSIRESNKSMVALSTCNGISGIIIDEYAVYYIQPGTDLKIDDDHFLIKHTDSNLESTCGNFNRSRENFVPEFMSDQSRIEKLRKTRATQSTNTVRVPYNSNRDSIYLELIVVVDYDSYRNLNMDVIKVYEHVKNLVNIVNSFYVPLNIFVALTGVIVWAEHNEIELSGDAELTLEKFVAYRKKKLVDKFPHDNAHLLLNKPFDCGVVGNAYEGLMCTTTYSGGITTNHSPFIGAVGTTMAHEIGHNFGLVHDDPQYCKCVDEKGCIMHYSTAKAAPKHWSSCSLEQFSVSFHKGINHCLKNMPTKLFGRNTCGNGFVEQDEECDCGLEKYCTNRCCNPKTCMLYENATCATGKCCDLSKCQFHTAGYECRKSKGECDLSEYCTETSEYCPTDVYKRNTEACRQGQAYCYHGSCRSHLDQCKLLWGPSGNPAYQCFKENINGNETGNCGFNKQIGKYKSCNVEDVYCGLLHCRQLTTEIEYGIPEQSIVFQREIQKNENIINCKTVILNLGREARDPGLTPNGAKCGENKMCVNEKCVSIDNLRKTGLGSACLNNCNGNGICNNKGNCHCFMGFEPPTCNDYGVGGSIDSGPLINFQETSKLFIVFIIVVLLITILTMCGVIYWHKHKSIPMPSELARKLSTAPREMIEIVKRASIPSREIARRFSAAPREIARKVSNAYTNVTNIQLARSKLRRTDRRHALSNSREIILNVDDL